MNQIGRSTLSRFAAEAIVIIGVMPTPLLTNAMGRSRSLA